MRVIFVFTTIFILLLPSACRNNGDTPDSVKTNFIKKTVANYPMSIGNENGQLQIYKTAYFEDSVNTLNEFVIKLIDFEDYDLEKEIRLDNLPKFKEVNKENTMEGLTLTDIYYDFIRANSLYFTCIFIHKDTNLQMKSKISMFCRTNRKGEIYSNSLVELKPNPAP